MTSKKLKYIQKEWLRLAWTNYFWLPGHFTKTWQLAGHL